MTSCKVFSCTKQRDRDELGERVTRWIQDARVTPVEAVVVQSSDEAFHCLSIVVFYEPWKGA